MGVGEQFWWFAIVRNKRVLDAQIEHKVHPDLNLMLSFNQTGRELENPLEIMIWGLSYN